MNWTKLVIGIVMLLVFLTSAFVFTYWLIGLWKALVSFVFAAVATVWLIVMACLLARGTRRRSHSNVKKET